MPNNQNIISGVCYQFYFLSICAHNYTTKLLFHQSLTRHSGYMVAGWWHCSHHWQLAVALGLKVDELHCQSVCQQLTTMTTPSSSSYHIVTMPFRWWWNWEFYCVHLVSFYEIWWTYFCVIPTVESNEVSLNFAFWAKANTHFT